MRNPHPSSRRSVMALGLVAASTATVLAACSQSEPAACTSGSALTVCAGKSTLKGIDVSSYQGTIQWSQVKAAGIAFSFARVSDGTAFPDADFAANWKAMKAQGIVRGVYQYFEPGVDPTAQAKLLLSSVAAAGGLEAGDLPPVMDIETTGGQSTTTIQAHMKTWLGVIENAVGRKPLIYTSSGFGPNIGTGFGAYPLWVANWGVTCPALPGGWTSWVFWQTADNGTVKGITGPVDLDEFDGTLGDLTAFALPASSNDGGVTPSDGGGASDASVDGGAAPGDGGDGGVAPSGDGGSADAANPCGP
jgi:lysozyme